jgi:uncharacterized membrane protein
MTTSARDEGQERTTGRLFGLSDAVFAIAMTLLTLDLRVPDLGDHPGDHVLRHALLDERSHYLSFLLSFYVIAGYWIRHNAETRTLPAGHPALLGRTILLLLAVCMLPFAANLLGTYGRNGISVAVYAAVNMLAVAALLQIRREARRHRLAGSTRRSPDLWFNLVAFALAIPLGYVLSGHGPLVIVGLLFLSGAATSFVTRRRARA